jgi:predicted nucleotidyltransferase
LADGAGTGLYAVQRELVRLEKAGLVIRTPRGNRVYYRANRSHPAFEDLKRVILKTIGLGDALRAALAPLADRVRVAFIYGSLARGEETAGSDIDLLLVGDLTLREASAVLGPAGRDLGREFNATVYPPEEFRTKAREGHHFISAVLKGEKIYLIGDEIALKGLAG